MPPKRKRFPVERTSQTPSSSTDSTALPAPTTTRALRSRTRATSLIQQVRSASRASTASSTTNSRQSSVSASASAPAKRVARPRAKQPAKKKLKIEESTEEEETEPQNEIDGIDNGVGEQETLAEETTESSNMAAFRVVINAPAEVGATAMESSAVAFTSTVVPPPPPRIKSKPKKQPRNLPPPAAPTPEPDTLLSAYNCPVCFSPPTNATLTPCGHVLCGECLFTAVKSTMRRTLTMSADPVVPRCPVCRAPIPGWNGKGGGVIGLRMQVVHTL